MRNKLKGPSALVLVSGTIILLFLARWLPINKIIGAGTPLSFFSLFDAVMPLTGSVDFGLSSLIFSLRTLLKVISFGFSPFFLLYHIPGLCAAASWSSSNKLIHVGIPLLCFGLFLAHPVGYGAAPYALYWALPIAISFWGRRVIFLQALSSTFIAHAVGSVLWLYSLKTTSLFWLSLIPVVAVERLMFASVMTLMYWVAVSVGTVFRKLTSEELQREGNA